MGKAQAVQQQRGGTGEFRQSTINVLAARCRALGAPVAVVGTQATAAFLLELLEKENIPCAGVFEKSPYPAECAGHSVKPLAQLAETGPDTVVIVTAPADAGGLEDTFKQTHAAFHGRVLCLEQLLDLPGLFQALETPLDYKYGAHILNEWAHHLDGKVSHWPHWPDGFSVQGKTVLEFGPFEGHFSMMLMAQKPERVIAVEGRADNFAKTALLKASLDWSNYTLRFGDMHLFPALVPENIDVIFCSGVLYHSEKPWWFLKSCLDKCDTIILSTHVSSDHSPEPRRFRQVTLDSGTYSFELFHEGGDNLSGLSSESLWFKEEDLTAFVNHHGFEYQKYREWTNPHGLWICSLLTRKHR